MIWLLKDVATAPEDDYHICLMHFHLSLAKYRRLAAAATRRLMMDCGSPARLWPVCARRISAHFQYGIRMINIAIDYGDRDDAPGKARAKI